MQVIGTFNRKIKIQQPDGVSNSATGNPSGSWVDYLNVYASRMSRRGKEKLLGNSPTSMADEVFIVRYNSSITEDMRVVFNDRNYEIYDIDEIGLRELTRLYCQKI